MLEATMDLTHRTMTDADVTFVRRLLLQVVADELGAAAWPEALREPLLEMQYRARKQGRQTDFPDVDQEILLLDGECAGWSVVARSDGEVRLVDVAVLPEFRRRGIATEFIRRLMDEAGRSGRCVRLSVGVANAAIQLCLGLGFRRTDGDGVRDLMEWSAGASGDTPVAGE